MANIGLMEGAFFVGRKEIMDWVNGTLELNLAKVEDTANGAVACQLLDIMHPNQVPMHKVNWAAKKDFEFVANYKILQTCFTKLGIDRHIDVPRLISGRYMDNLEFMQWFKRFFEMHVSDKGDYDCVGQRAKGKGNIISYSIRISVCRDSSGDAIVNNLSFFCLLLLLCVGGDVYGGGKASVAAPASTKSAASARTTTGTTKPSSATSTRTATKTTATSKVAPTRTAATTKTAASRLGTKAGSTNQENAAPNRMAAPGKVAAGSTATSEDIKALKAANEEAERANQELRQEMEGLEKERDFYFDKLREVEILLQEKEDKGETTELSAAIFKILYATIEGFEQVEEGEITEGADTVDGEERLEVGAAEEETY